MSDEQATGGEINGASPAAHNLAGTAAPKTRAPRKEVDDLDVIVACRKQIDQLKEEKDKHTVISHLVNRYGKEFARAN